MKVKMKSSVVYRGLSLNAGWVFDLDNSFAKELIECKRAIKIEEPKETKKVKKSKVKAGE